MLKRTFMTGVMLALCAVTASASVAPKAATFKDPTTGKTCAATGQPGAKDPVENSLKNRITVPGATTATTVAEFRNLPIHDKAARSTWSAADLATFKKLETAPVRIVGYLLGVKPEGAEATNCKFTDAAGIDYHMWLVDTDDKDKGRAFGAVVELTPRWRNANAAWTLPALQALVKQGAQVRISGWRLFDYEHPEQLPANNSTNPTRSTLWEIHPITKIEVATKSGWVELGAPAAKSPATLVRPKPGKTVAPLTETNTGE